MPAAAGWSCVTAPQQAPAELALLLSWAQTKNKTNTAIIEVFGLLCLQTTAHTFLPLSLCLPHSLEAHLGPALLWVAQEERWCNSLSFPTSIVFSSSKCHVHLFSTMALAKKVL